MGRHKILEWSATDDALIREKYPSCGSNIEELLGRYTVAQIRVRAHFLNVKRLDRSCFVTSACRTYFNGAWYATEKDAAVAAGRSESWIRAHRNKETGIVDSLPSGSFVSDSEQFNVVVNDIECKDCRQLADEAGWKYTGRLAEAFRKCDLDNQFIVDKCIALGVVPQSYVRLFKEFGAVDAVDRYIKEHPLAFQNGSLLSRWKSIKSGGCSASVIINGERVVSGSGLAAALGVSRDGRYAQFLRDETVNHQELVDESIRDGVPLFDLWLGRSNSSSKSKLSSCKHWSEDELEIIRDASLDDVPSLPGRTRQSIVDKMYRLGMANGTRMHVRDAYVARAWKGKDDYFYVSCKICGRVYLLAKDDALAFSHDMCKDLVAVPDGWFLPYSLDH